MNWEVALRLFLLCLIPAGVSIGFYFIQKKTKFNKLGYWWQQVIIGILFGGIAILGSEVGVDVGGGVMANVRDAGPLCAGLIFGGPAGMIAGVIGGVGRAIQPYIEGGKGLYSQIACSVSTIIAGGYAWFLRKFMFDDKRPNWGFGLAIGMIMEVIHMSILILTKMDNLTRVYEIIKQLALPMIIFNGLAVMIPCLTLEIINRKEQPIKGRYKKLTNQIQIWMLVSVVAAFALTTVITFFAESSNAINDADIKLNNNIDDVKSDVGNSLNTQIMSIAKTVGNLYKDEPNKSNVNCEMLQTWCALENVNIQEINIISQKDQKYKDPYISVSSTAEFDPTSTGGTNIVYMNTAQTKPFNCLFAGLNHQEQYIQEACERQYEEPDTHKHKFMKYAGISLMNYGVPEGDKYLQIGYEFVYYLQEIKLKVSNLSTYRHVGNTGKIIVCYDKKPDEFGNVTYWSISEGNEERNLNEAGFRTDILPGVRYESNVVLNAGENARPCYYKYNVVDGIVILAVIPVEEVNSNRDNNIILTTFMEVIIFAILFAIIYFLIKKLVVNNLSEVNKDLSKIIDGNLDVTLKVKGSDEFESLSDDINTTVTTLKHYIDEAAHRIDAELEFAKSIQMSALPNPNVYPAFPNIKTVDILAKMVTAREVGGDFYDYYLIDSRRIAFLIADVSGKGIPAAMFMMQSKATIKNYAAKYEDTSKIVEFANAELCKENDAGMFVTCWFGIIDRKTGEITYTNAGHNPPALYRKKTNTWEYIPGKFGFVLAGLDGAKYTQSKVYLEPGDKLFLYTDGVTEATNNDQKLYGEDRLMKYLNKSSEKEIHKTLDGLKADIDIFVGEAPQFDDITMLMVEFVGEKEENK